MPGSGKRCEEHSSEIHLMREWMGQVNILLAPLPDIKKNVADMKISDALQEQSLRSINATTKWILGFLTTIAAGVIIAYIRSKM